MTALILAAVSVFSPCVVVLGFEPTDSHVEQIEGKEVCTLWWKAELVNECHQQLETNVHLYFRNKAGDVIFIDDNNTITLRPNEQNTITSYTEGDCQTARESDSVEVIPRVKPMPASYSSNAEDPRSCGREWWRVLRSYPEDVQRWLMLPRQDEIITYDLNGDGKDDAALITRSESPMEPCNLPTTCDPKTRVNSVDMVTLPDHKPLLAPAPWCGGILRGIQWQRCEGFVACLDVHEIMFDGTNRVYRIQVTPPDK